MVYPEGIPGAERGRRVEPHGRAAMMSEDLTTMEMAAVSEVVLTWTSTVATQAAFMGKPAVYFSPPAGFDTHLVTQGAALLADAETLRGLLHRVLEDPPAPGAVRRRLLDAGYVVDADGRMAEMILETPVHQPGKRTP